jgi:hypothetical protein
VTGAARRSESLCDPKFGLLGRSATTGRSAFSPRFEGINIATRTVTKTALVRQGAEALRFSSPLISAL